MAVVKCSGEAIVVMGVGVDGMRDDWDMLVDPGQRVDVVVEVVVEVSGSMRS